MLRLDATALDYTILAIYFVTVLGIGFAAKRYVKTSLDFFLSGRSLPAWITGLAFIAANLGAIEILGMAANGAQYGIATVHFYWIGAVPAMVFLGLVMMPFYYGSKVRSVPEYLRLRFNDADPPVQRALVRGGDGADRRRQPVRPGARGARAARLADLGPRSCVAAGVRARLHHPRRAVVRDLQRGPAVLRHLRQPDPADRARAGDGRRLGRPQGRRSRGSKLGDQGVHAWQGPRTPTRTASARPGSRIVFGLGFVLSFGYWTTNFTEVQRALRPRT